MVHAGSKLKGGAAIKEYGVKAKYAQHGLTLRLILGYKCGKGQGQGLQ